MIVFGKNGSGDGVIIWKFYNIEMRFYNIETGRWAPARM